MTKRGLVVLGVYSTREALDAAMSQFKSAGLQDTDISVVLPDKKGAQTVSNLKASEAGSVSDQVKNLASTRTEDISSGSHRDVAPQNTKTTQAAGAGVGVGAALGGALGWVATLTGLAIPGIGLFLVAGPLIGALAGGAAGGAVGVLVGLGIPESEAKLYEDRLKKGGMLLSVHTDSSSEAERVRTIFTQTGATDVATGQQAQ